MLNTLNYNNEDGVVLYDAYDCLIENNTASYNNKSGISVMGDSRDITIRNNTAKNNSGDGIFHYATHTSLMKLNKLENNSDSGISAHYSDNLEIINNSILNNNYGIYNYNLTLSTIEKNNLSNGTIGISLSSSNNNLIYNNYFNNTNNAYDDGNNVWNITKTAGTNIIGDSWRGGNYWSDYEGEDLDGDGLGDTPYDILGGTNKDYLPLMIVETPPMFDTGPGTYPSIRGTHTGIIKPLQDIFVHKLYTYPCAGTGGHTEYVHIYGNGIDKSASGTGYSGDWQNITFDEPFTLFAEKTYNYEIRTGSYPQIIHKPEHTTVDGSFINCTSFVDANGKEHTGWIPAIRLE